MIRLFLILALFTNNLNAQKRGSRKAPAKSPKVSSVVRSSHMGEVDPVACSCQFNGNRINNKYNKLQGATISPAGQGQQTGAK